MKLKRYNPSGNTQRNGITATSWHILLVVANRSTDAQAGRSNHKIFCVRVGATACSRSEATSLTDGVRQNFIAQKAHATTYTANPHPHKRAWLTRVNCVSKKTG